MRRRTWHATRVEAERAATDLPSPSGDSASPTLGDAVAAYSERLAARGRSERHRREYDRLQGILGRLWGIPVRSLTADLYREWNQTRTRGGSSARVLVLVRAVVHHAMRLGWLDRDPLAAVEYGRPEPGPWRSTARTRRSD